MVPDWRSRVSSERLVKPRDLLVGAMALKAGFIDFAQFRQAIQNAQGQGDTVARALVSSPRLILLDEPAGGLNHEELQDLHGLILAIRDQLGVTVLLVEHHMERDVACTNFVADETENVTYQLADVDLDALAFTLARQAAHVSDDVPGALPLGGDLTQGVLEFLPIGVS